MLRGAVIIAICTLVVGSNPGWLRIATAQPDTTDNQPTEAPPASGLPTPFDPAPADWGRFLRPGIAPLAVPEVDYLLVQPPQGVIQRASEEGYEQIVQFPDETFNEGPVSAPGVDTNRPDGLAPIGVLGDHTLSAGMFLISYRYNISAADDLRDGTSNLSLNSVLAQFPFAPTHSQVQRHTLLMEFAPTDDLTVMATLPFIDIDLNFASRTGATVHDGDVDPGDVTLRALYVLKRWGRQQVHANFGLSLPLGVLPSERFPPSPTSPAASYLARTSSGTYDLLPGLTYRGQTDWWTWGAQGLGIVRLGLNNASYRLGNNLELTTWLSRRVTDYLSVSTRLDANLWGPIAGSDERLNPFLAPTNRTDDWAGRRIDLLFGANLFATHNDFGANQWLSVEAGVPVYQSLSGPQLKTEWLLNAGWNLRF